MHERLVARMISVVQETLQAKVAAKRRNDVQERPQARSKEDKRRARETGGKGGCKEDK